MPLHPNLNFLMQTPPFWSQLSQPHVMACGLRLTRNLQRFNFVPKLEEHARSQIFKFISSALKENPALNDVCILQAKQASGEDKELLLERFPFLDGINQACQDEAFVLDSSGSFTALINFKEHLELQMTAPGEKLDELLARLVEIESYLGRSLEFAFHQRFGFLSSDPRYCGTGLLASVIVHLPALIQTGQFDALVKEHADENIRIVGIQAEGFPADLVLLQNQQAIGLSEEKIVSSLQSLVSRLVIAESSLCRQIQEKPDISLMDKVSRAFGLLRHSYLLDTIESMQALSLVKLGILLGWVHGISLEQVHHLFIGSQRLHMKWRHRDIGQNMNHERAVSLHEAISTAHLTI